MVASLGWGCFSTVGVLFVSVLVIRALLCGVQLGPLILGNSHGGINPVETHIGAFSLGKESLPRLIRNIRDHKGYQ